MATTLEAELLQYVADVVLHCVHAHVEPSRDLRIGQSVAHALGHLPFSADVNTSSKAGRPGLAIGRHANGLGSGIPYAKAYALDTKAYVLETKAYAPADICAPQVHAYAYKMHVYGAQDNPPVPQRISFRSRPRYDAVSGLDPQHKLARDLRISFR